MEELNCSLCCDKTFSSKQSLIEHLINVLYNLSCPICNYKLSSLSTLVEHLTLNNCEARNIDQAVVYLENNSLPENDVTENSNSDEFSLIDAENHNNVTPDQFSSEQSPDHSADVGEMYVELLSKQMTKPCLQTQGVKLIMEEGENHYTLITNEDPSYSSQTVVTKQNSDGTISLIDEKDINSARNVKQHKEATSYSCNTCGVTFTSVLDHIQNYHNDQDVVVEEPADDSSTVMPMEYESSLVLYNNMSDKRMSQRVITESGNIVEAPLDSKDDAGTHQEPIVEQTTSNENESTESSIKKEEAEIDENNGKETTKRNAKVDELGYSFVKDVKKGKKEPYHKVLVKEMQMIDGDNTTKVKVYNCVTCHIYVANVEEFRQHPCKQHYPCPQCPVAYDNSKALCAHMKAHKNGDAATVVETEDTGIYKCGICSTVFPTNKSLKLHKRMHDPVKSRPIEPPVTLASGEAVSADKYLCGVCDKLIPKDYKAIHQSFHKNDNALNCDICNRKFQSAEYLQMHMKVHNVDKAPVNNQDKSLPYNCLYCNRQFARPHEKVKHERIHTGEKPHSCEICGKSFRVSYCLTLHMRTHTGARPYACPHCGKRFKAHSVYNHHLQTHSEVRAYKCPYCPKAFKTSVQLAGHKNSHTKPFSCQHCNRPFASLYAVRVHTETHLRRNNLKFSCALCGASYARTFALKDHMKQAHDREMDTADPLTSIKDNDWTAADIIKRDSDDTQSHKDVDQQSEARIAARQAVGDEN